MMDQASAVQMNIVCNASEEVLLGRYFLQVGDVPGGFVNIAPPSNQSAYWNVSYHETRFC
jgi:hypothetical protein